MAKVVMGKCASCGCSWAIHDGPALLCKQLKLTRSALLAIRTGAANGKGQYVLPQEVVKLCDEVLENTQ
jgi:hypothetical protein